MECAPKECKRLCCSTIQDQHEITDELQTDLNDWLGLLSSGVALSTSCSATFLQLYAFSATSSLVSNFQCIGQLPSFCVSIVTIMLLLRVKKL